ncbi:MAG TPA: histidine kinase [Bryobacteraceae bacterium]|jgi:two-component system LytT family sensor kinase|nr:histidine kinase [Bryobacteraceae bacterium]
MPEVAGIDPYLAANLIGYTAGLVISILLLVLTLRAARIPGTRAPNLLAAVCSISWNLGGLGACIQNPLGIQTEPGTPCMAMAIQFTGAAIWPIAILVIWRRLAVERWQCNCWRFLQALAFLHAAVIMTGFWAAVASRPILPLETLKEWTAYGAAILLGSGAIMLLRGRSASRTLWLSSLVVLLGLLITTLSVIIHTNIPLRDPVRGVLMVSSQQSVLLIILGTFFLFARFRFADLFIRYSLRIVLASASAVAFVFLMNAPFFVRVAGQTEFPGAFRLFGSTILVTGLLLCFAPLDRSIGRLVTRWIFQAPDYRNAARELGDELQRLYVESEMTEKVETSVRSTLVLEGAHVIAVSRLPESLWPAETHSGEVTELEPGNPLGSLLALPEVELLVPVRVGGRVISVLAISPGAARRTLLSQELNYLRNVAVQLGGRLDLLRLEHEMAERQNREALLLQQVTEAELRALRAQINPHFLFNSLNTIANLIVTNPERAETMTLRLAKVFRYVLAQSSRPLIPIREEIEFVRAYLEIEEARFGSRLQVEIDISAEVALDHVPSLILQPVVENALKHGLSPKPGPGRLWILAKLQGDQVCLKVEDDGVGPGSASLRAKNGNGAHTEGVGLTNIAQRLTTLYQDRAQVTLERRDPVGTSVTLLMPRDFGRNGDAKPHS